MAWPCQQHPGLVFQSQLQAPAPKGGAAVSTLVCQPVITGKTHHWRDGARTVGAQHQPLQGDIKVDQGGANGALVSMGHSNLWTPVATTEPNSRTVTASLEQVEQHGPSTRITASQCFGLANSTHGLYSNHSCKPQLQRVEL